MPTEEYAARMRKQEAEVEEKRRAMNECGQAMGLMPSRATLRDRLKQNLERYDRERERMEKMNELYSLLDRHPELARILELIEDLGV